MGAVHHIKRLGLGALELGWVRSVRVTDETCLAIREAVKETGVLLSIHAPYYINLNGDAAEWPKSRARLMAAAHYGNLAGATEIIFHPGSYQEKSPSDAVSIAINRLQGCVSELRQENNFVTLRPETMGRAGQLGTLEETLEISKAIKGVQPCVDFAHLHARAGDGRMNSYAEWKTVLELYKKELGIDALQNMSCHLSGIEYGPRGEKHHLILEEADLKIEELFKALGDAGAGGRLLSESPNLEEDALVFKTAWDAIAK